MSDLNVVMMASPQPPKHLVESSKSSDDEGSNVEASVQASIDHKKLKIAMKKRK